MGSMSPKKRKLGGGGNFFGTISWRNFFPVPTAIWRKFSPSFGSTKDPFILDNFLSFFHGYVYTRNCDFAGKKKHLR